MAFFPTNFYWFPCFRIFIHILYSIIEALVKEKSVFLPSHEMMAMQELLLFSHHYFHETLGSSTFILYFAGFYEP